MASLDFPRDPNRDGGITHPMNPYESHVWTARRMAPSASPLKLAEALLVMAARAGPGQAKIDEAGCVFSRQIWTKTGVLRTMDSTRQNDATSGCKQQKRSFFFGSTQRELLVEPKASQSSIDQPQAAFIHNCRSPGGGRAGKKISGWLFVVHCWMKRPRKRFWANRGDVNLPQFVLQSCHMFVKQSWSWNHMVYINNTYENTIFSGLFTSINPIYFDVNILGVVKVLTHCHMVIYFFYRLQRLTTLWPSVKPWPARPGFIRNFANSSWFN